MTRAEFNEWTKDFARRFPDTGAWVFGLPSETLDLWYQDIFAPFELRDAMAMNTKLMIDGIPTKWDRDGLPRLFIKTMSNIVHGRKERQRAAGKRRSGTDVKSKGIIQGDPCMSKMYSYVTNKMDEFKLKHPDQCEKKFDRLYTPVEMVKQWTQEASDLYDNMPDSNEPHFRCIKCEDTGVRGHEKLKNTVGCCDCETGQKRANQQWRASGRQLGPADIIYADDNPFNDALQERGLR